MFKPKNIFKHYCELAIEDDLPRAPPHVSRFRKFLYSFREFKTVRKSFVTQQFFRSNYAFMKEKKRHFTTPEYRYTIHPLSQLADIERTIIFFVWGILFVMAPLTSAFSYNEYFAYPRLHERNPSEVVMTICQVLLSFDIIFRCFLGRVGEGKKILLDRKILLKRYLKRFLIFDLGPPVSGLLLHSIPNIGKFSRLLFYQINNLILIRFGAFLKIMNFILKGFKLHRNSRICVQLVVMSIYFIHWWTCIMKFVIVVYEVFHFKQLDSSWYFRYTFNHDHLADRHNESEINRIVHIYINQFSIVSTHFFGAGIGRYPTEDEVEMILLALILLSGMCLYVYAFSKILYFYGTTNISETRYEQLIYEAQQHMARFRYPKSLRRGIYKYYDFKFDKKFFNENEILNTLSEHLRMEVVLYSCTNLIQNIRIFRNVSRTTVGYLLTLLKPEIYLPTDVIMTIGEHDKKLFFVVYGTCTVQLLSGEEIFHCEDGDYFGDIGSCVFENYKYPFEYKVVALEPCQLYVLEKNEVMICLQMPDLGERLRKLEKERERKYQRLFSQAIEETKNAQTTVIVDELRKSHIVSSGRKRIDIS